MVPYEHVVILLVILFCLFSCLVWFFARTLLAGQKKLIQYTQAHRLKMDLLEQEIKCKEARAGEFLDVCADLFNQSDLNQLCEAVMDIIVKTMMADQGSLMLLNPEQQLRIVASRGLAEEVVSQVHLRLGERVSGLAASEKREFLINGPLGDYPLFHGIESNPILRSSIICPILYEKEVPGVLNMSRISSEERFSVSDLKKATALAHQVAVAINYQRMCKELRDHAIHLKKAYHYLRQSQHKFREMEKVPTPLRPSTSLKSRAAS